MSAAITLDHKQIIEEKVEVALCDDWVVLVAVIAGALTPVERAVSALEDSLKPAVVSP
jgi:hypothetical protein